MVVSAVWKLEMEHNITIPHTHRESIVVWNIDLREKLEMAWNKALENQAHAKSTWRSYEKWIVFFSFLIHWVMWRMTKNSWHDLACFCCLKCWVSSFFREVSTIWGEESYFSKNKGMKFSCVQKNRLFIISVTLDPNLYEY